MLPFLFTIVFVCVCVLPNHLVAIGALPRASCRLSVVCVCASARFPCQRCLCFCRLASVMGAMLAVSPHLLQTCIPVQLGVLLDEKQKSMVLITDAIGVVIDPYEGTAFRLTSRARSSAPGSGRRAALRHRWSACVACRCGEP